MWKWNGRQLPPFAVQPKEGERSVWLFPRPPSCTVIHKRVRVIGNDAAKTVIADSTKAIEIAETASAPVYYIPKTDINMKLLKKIGRITHCEWKGQCSYWDVVLPDGQSYAAKTFGYEHPQSPYESISDCIAFYADFASCFIGDEQVTPQGGYYAGWCTKDLVGPIKGQPGAQDG